METYTRSEQSQQIAQGRKIQNGNTRNDPDFPTDRGVGDVHRLLGHLLPYTHTKPIKKISEISCTGQNQFKALPFGLSTAPLEFTVVTKEVKLMALQKGIRMHQYLNDWLVRPRSHQTCLQHTQTLEALCQDLGWLVNMEKSELDPKQVFDFLPVRPDREKRVRSDPSRTHPGPVADTDNQNQRIINWADLSDPATHAPQRAVDSNRKAGSPRSSAYEAHSVAPQTKLEGFRVTRKGDTSSQVAPSQPKMVAGGKQCAPGSAITPA